MFIPNYGGGPRPYMSGTGMDILGGMGSGLGMSDAAGMPSTLASPTGMPMTSPGMTAPLVPSVVPTVGGVTTAGVPRLAPGPATFMDKAQLGLTGIATIGQLWGAFQAAKLAKAQFKYTKNVTETNMANQLKTYNSALTDRANNRQIVEGRSPEQTKAYIDANQLKRYGG